MSTTGTRTSKRSSAKRSTAKRSGTPRTTSGGNGAKVEPKVEDLKATAEAEAAETVEMSVEEVLVQAITEDGSRIFDLESGKELKGDDRVAHILSIQAEAVKLAERAKARYHDFHLANGELATRMMDLRQSIMMPDGIPDWFGGSETYKKLVSKIIDAAFTEGEDTRPTVVNRLQKRCARMAPLRIALYANAKQKLNLPEDEVQRILQLEEKATEGDEAKNDKTARLVAAVNAQYRVGQEAKGNKQKSPFVSKTAGSGGSPGTLTAEEQKAVDAANNLPLFRNAIQHLTAEKYLPELVALVQEIRKTLISKKNPAFGDAGIQGAVGHLRNAEVIVHATGKELDGHKLDKDEKEAVELAMKAA